MPGVTVKTSTRSGIAAPNLAESSTYFVAGQAERGSVSDAILLRSMADYDKYLGARVAYGAIYDDLKTFFEEGGTRAYVSRVVGTTPTVATKTLNDRAGSPLATLRIDAKDPGVWGASLTVAVAAGTASGTYKLTITYSGTGGNGTEVFDNLTTPADAVTALANSDYVRATDLGSATAAPNNQPAIVSAQALVGGTDDRGTIVAANYTAALARFGIALGSGAVSIPGQTSANVGAGLIAHAVANNRLALTSVALGSNSAAAISAAAALRSTSGAEYAGLFYPWIKVPDGSGGVRTISPEGYVAACRARAHEQEGAFRAPGGEIAKARFVLGVEVEIDRATGDNLNDNAVNAIRTIIGSTRLYGWRSLSTDASNYRLLTGRDMLNFLVTEAYELLEPFVFRTIDGRGRMFSDMGGVLLGLVEPLRERGGLYEKFDDAGNRIDPGYRVDTGPGVNTSTTISNNEAHAALSVRVSPTGELVILNIAKVGVTAAV